MPDPVVESPPPAPPPAPPATPWHQGIDAELIGHWQNRGYKIDDAKDVAIAAGKQARELEKHFGVPAEQLLKLPKADAKPEEIKAFRERLGAPADPKGYDFSGVKDSAGNPIAAPLADALRAAAHNAGLPKDAAATVAAAIQKYNDDAKTSEETTFNGALAEQKAKLKADWGQNYDFNLLKAMDGVRRLGLSQDAVTALEKTTSYSEVMNALRRVGMSTSEDTFIERGATTGGTPSTREGAMARKQELMGDTAWRGRYLSGGVAENREMTAINMMIDGDK